MHSFLKLNTSLNTQQSKKEIRKYLEMNKKLWHKLNL